ncbi:MAG: hypothetical protein QW666_04115 [Candidatus Woesearchaeota archaeon]
METIFKEFPISLEYVVYFSCTSVLLLAIAILESKNGAAFLAFLSGIISIFFALLSCWDLMSIGIIKHRVFGIIFFIITLFLFLGLIYDFIQAI